jgi:hypothetical protein
MLRWIFRPQLMTMQTNDSANGGERLPTWIGC